MKHFEIIFETGGIFSTNLFDGGSIEAAEAAAEANAARHGYTVTGVYELTEQECKSARAKGMPIIEGAR